MIPSTKSADEARVGTTPPLTSGHATLAAFPRASRAGCAARKAEDRRAFPIFARVEKCLGALPRCCRSPTKHRNRGESPSSLLHGLRRRVLDPLLRQAAPMREELLVQQYEHLFRAEQRLQDLLILRREV